MRDADKYKRIRKDKNIITSDEILGRDVIDSEGHNIGMVTQMHIDKVSKSIVGISIDSGFNKPFVFVGIDLIKNFGVDAVYISKTPSSRYLGLLVFDQFGVEIGRVDSVDFDSKEPSVIAIYVNIGFGRRVRVEKKFIRLIGMNVILNVEKVVVKEMYSIQKKESKENH